MSILQIIKYGVPAVIIALLLIIIGAQHLDIQHQKEVIANKEKQLAAQAIVLEQARVNYTKEVKRLDKAKKEADRWHAYSIEQMEVLSSASVPSDCEGAVQWAFEKLHNL